MFGPFTAKDGCKERKRYGALFTCLSSRAVHIEVMHVMTTDSFIMCLRRFIGHLGYVWMIRTDNGTNFVGASAEFIESFQEKKKALWPLFMDGVQLPQGYSHFEEAVYFLPLSSQKFLVLILSTSEG